MYKVIVIGTGGIGKRHIRGFIETGRAELTFVEPHEVRRQQAVEAFSPTAAYADLGDVDLAGFDLAVICAPANLHLPMMLACARAGTHFLVEKPLAVTMESVDETLEEVRNSGVIGRVGYIRRIAPELNAARDSLRAGKIGDVKLVYFNGSQEFPKYRPDYRETYYARPEMGGGAILDGASHTFDSLIWTLGRPKTVMAMYDRLVLDGSETEDTALISIRFENGAYANITMNQFQKRNVATTEFIGTKGNLLLEHSVLSFADDDSGTWKERHDFMDGLKPMEAHQARFTIQANAMLDAIEGKPDTLADLDDARLNLRVALAAKQSWKERRIIDLDEVET